MLLLKDRKVSLTCLAFSPGGGRLAAGGYRGLVQVWDLASQSVAHTLPGCEQFVRALFFLSESELLGEEDGPLHLWDPATGEYLGRWPPGMQFDGGRAALASGARALFLHSWQWIEQVVTYRYRLARHSLPGYGTYWSIASPVIDVKNLACTADGSLLACGTSDNQIVLLDGATGKRRQTIERTGAVNALAFSPDGKMLAWCAATRLRLWRVEPAAEVKHTSFGRTHFLSVAFHPSGDFFATANGDGKVDYWDARSGEHREAFDWKIGKLHDVVFDAAGDRAACCSKSGEIVIWDVDR